MFTWSTIEPLRRCLKGSQIEIMCIVHPTHAFTFVYFVEVIFKFIDLFFLKNSVNTQELFTNSDKIYERMIGICEGW